MRTEYDAIVVGSGPNGLAAAIELARAGCSVLLLEANDFIGGATRTAELTLPGFRHDLGAAIHPLGLGSPFFQTLPLAEHGLSFLQPEIALAHPLDHGRAAVLHREVDRTADALGEANYRRLLAPLVRQWDALAAEFLQPMLHLPRHPFALARFGAGALWPARLFAQLCFRTEAARALFAGMAAHSFLPLEALASAAFGLVLGAAGHAVGWPVAQGGSQSIADALASYLRALGGEIVTGQRVADLNALPKHRALLLDLTTWQFLRLAGERLPAGYRARLERFRHAPAVFKMDYALSAPVPWAAEACRRAGTVHVGGTLEEIAASERSVAAGRVPEKPFVLVAQQSLCDATRAPRGQHTLWAYSHVPNECKTDGLAEAIERQIERFAPGFRDCVLARHFFDAATLEQWNPNLVAGDINGGAANFGQLLARPVFSPAPYRTPLRGVYLCSSSTPPGGGVHGMCGYHAARTAVRDLFR